MHTPISCDVIDCPEAQSAVRWAEYLRDEFSLSLNRDCPFVIEPGLDRFEAEQVTIAGVVVASHWRDKPASSIAVHVASRLASPRAKRAAIIEWFDYPFELIGFIAHQFREVTNDAEFAAWLRDLQHEPRAFTAHYIAWQAQLKNTSAESQPATLAKAS